MTDPLSTWNEGPVKAAVLAFVERAATELPVEDRVAVFDNDGTLWCEKPMPIQLDFILRRLVEMAEDDPALQERQPWKAAYERDYALVGPGPGGPLRRRRHEPPVVAAGLLAAFSDITVDAFEDGGGRLPAQRPHPTLGRGYLECAYAPMVELLSYLRANGFANYIASGGGRDFMRPISDELYGIPRERVIGSAVALTYTPDENGGAITRQAAADYLDDGPEKPVHIWTRTGRRPVLAAGNSNGDIEMLDFTQQADKPSLRLLVLHDDAEREFDYVTGAEQALDRAAAERLDGRQHQGRLGHGVLTVWSAFRHPDLDHQLVGEPLEHRPQLLRARRRRGAEHRPGLEQRPAGHRSLPHVGDELFDVDADGGQGRGDLGHDAGVVGPEETEVEPLQLGLDGLVGPLEDSCSPGAFRAVRSATSASSRSSGTATDTLPANLPASRDIWLDSQLAPCASIAAEMADTTPGRSSPVTVRMSVAIDLSHPPAGGSRR